MNSTLRLVGFLSIKTLLISTLFITFDRYEKSLLYLSNDSKRINQTMTCASLTAAVKNLDSAKRWIAQNFENEKTSILAASNYNEVLAFINTLPLSPNNQTCRSNHYMTIELRNQSPGLYGDNWPNWVFRLSAGNAQPQI